MPLQIGKWLRGMHLERVFQGDHSAIAKAESFGESKLDDIFKKAVEITENIKNWVNNPIEDLIVKLLPQWAEQVEGKLETYLPIILSGLLAIKDPLAMQEALKNVKFSGNFYWDKFFHDVAVAIANVLADGQVNFADISVAIQFAKDEFFSNKPAE
jgi:hypothetical protein